MSRLDELIQELCPDGVPFRKLEDCCNVLDRKRKPVTKAAREAGQYPYYGANGIQDYVSDYIFDGTFVLVGEDGSVITPTGKPVVNWATGKIWVNNHAHIVEETDGVLLRYLYHYIQTIDVTPLIHGNIPKLTGGDFRALSIPVPPIEVQREIVRILDKFTKLSAELSADLSAELSARQKQYDYYRDRLFDIGCEVLPITTIAHTYIGLVTTMTKHYVPHGVKLIHNSNVKENRFEFKENTYLDEAFANQNSSRRHRIGDIITVHTGDVGTSAIIDEELDGSLGFATIVSRIYDDTIITPKYLCYYFNSRRNKQNIASMIKGDRNNLNLKDFNQLKVPVPSLETQHRIVSILDRFDTLCNDLSSGLPAEIEARRKQYEYYRDKLLTFKPLA